MKSNVIYANNYDVETSRPNIFAETFLRLIYIERKRIVFFDPCRFRFRASYNGPLEIANHFSVQVVRHVVLKKEAFSLV